MGGISLVSGADDRRDDRVYQGRKGIFRSRSLVSAVFSFVDGGEKASQADAEDHEQTDHITCLGEKKVKNRKTIRWLCQKGKSSFVPLLVFSACNVLLSVVSVWFALVSKQVIDTATGQRAGSLRDSFLILIGFLLLQLLLQTALNLMDVNISGKLEIKLKEGLFRNLLEKQWQATEGYHTGELMNRLTSDIRIVVSGIVTIIPAFLSMLVKICSSFAVLYLLAPALAVCIVALGPIVFLFGRLYSRKMKRLHKQCQQSDGVTRSYMQEILQNSLAVKAFEKENAAVQVSRGYQLENFKLKRKRNYFSLLANICLFLIFTAGYYITLGWGAYSLSLGTMTYGTLTAMLQLVGQLQTPFKNLSSLLSSAYATLASAERMMELEELEEEKLLPCDLETKDFDHLAVDKISFQYPGVTVYQNASLVLKKGEFLAIAGHSGIGKSTLLKLLLGILRPQEGHLYVYDKDGKQAEISRCTRRFFSYVPQGNMILSGTIRDNIRFYREEFSDDQVEQCAKIAQMEEFLQELPQGLDTVLKEGGEGLSEGQIQRIAIARALLGDAPVLLLDEATSALDEATEEAVLRQIKSMTEKTCIIVSHKRAAFSICDKTALVQDGGLEVREETL